MTHANTPAERRPPPPRRARLARSAFAAVSLLLGAGALAGCSGVAFVNAVEPSGGVQITRDIAYEPGPRGGLDVYRPRGALGAPVVMFIYGGSWDSGRRQDYRFVGAALARQGFVAVIPDYRLYPEVRWPTFLQDNARALAWTRAHAAEYGGDPAKLFLMGHSAGAYDVAMLTLDRRWLGAVGLDPRRDLRGAIGLAGPYDFLPLHSEELKTIFGPPEGRPATQPISYVDGQAPPMLLATDTADKVVDPGNTARLAARLRERGGAVEVRDYPGLSHVLVIGAIAAPLRFLAPVLKDASAFIRAHAGPPS
jgi:acetyl esterase/lipase